MKKCQICQKQAYFECSKCESKYYCSKDHQIEHWKNGHREDCQKVRGVNQDELAHLVKRRYLVRKQYFENYSSRQNDFCVIDAKALISIEKRIFQVTGSIIDRFDYGASICLLTKSYLLIKDIPNAKNLLTGYLDEEGKFLKSMDNLPSLQNVDEKKKEIFLLKMNLLSTIANLCHALEMNCLEYYVLYTKNVEKVYGQTSNDASNCYFLIGCYLAEEGYFNKAIECFKKSAAIRKESEAGDCYFNIGILYKLQKKLPKALSMFERALKAREQHYGQDSDQIAEVNENMGIIYVQLNDFKTAMLEYEKAYRVRSTNKVSKQFLNLQELIEQLKQKLTLYLASSYQAQLKKPEIFTHLKKSLEGENFLQRESKKLKKEETLLDEINKTKKSQPEKKKKKSLEKDEIFVLTDDFLNRLDPAELFKLSELQTELSACKTRFGLVSAIGASAFLNSLSPERLTEFKEDNEQLFELLCVEQQKIKNK